jgi:hypothetical protein
MNPYAKFLILCVLILAFVNEATALAGPRVWATSVLKKKCAEEWSTSFSRAQSVLDEKATRTAAQKKIDSQLLYALKQKRGEKRGVPTEPIKLDLDQKGRALVDITGKISPQISNQIQKLGGIVISEEPQYHTMRARLALEKLEALAGRKDVSFIAPAAQSMNNRVNTHVRPN